MSIETLNNLNKDRKTEKNQSTRFLMPLVQEGSGNTYSTYLRKGIDNCYLYDDNNIILVYFLTNDNIRLDEVVKENSLFQESIDIEGGDKIGYIFSIPDKYKDDVELFKQGLYSQFSEDMKNLILSFWELKNVSSNNVLYGTLYKTDEGKEFGESEKEEGDEFAEEEYWMKPNIEVEQFSNIYQKA